MRYGLVYLLLLVFAASVAGQNLVANGDFELGTTGWTNVRFNDPLGTHGVRLAPVLVGQPSHALFADFQTLTPVMESRYDSDPFLAEAKEYPVSFDCMWEKKVTTPVPSPSVNYIMLIFRAQNSTSTLQSFQVQVPQQAGTEERKSYQGKIKFPTVGNYVVQVFMRHSNLAGMPYFVFVETSRFSSRGDARAPAVRTPTRSIMSYWRVYIAE